jgi:hypothetical protein
MQIPSRFAAQLILALWWLSQPRRATRSRAPRPHNSGHQIRGSLLFMRDYRPACAVSAPAPWLSPSQRNREGTRARRSPQRGNQDTRNSNPFETLKSEAQLTVETPGWFTGDAVFIPNKSKDVVARGTPRPTRPSIPSRIWPSPVPERSSPSVLCGFPAAATKPWRVSIRRPIR